MLRLQVWTWLGGFCWLKSKAAAATRKVPYAGCYSGVLADTDRSAWENGPRTPSAWLGW